MRRVRIVISLSVFAVLLAGGCAMAGRGERGRPAGISVTGTGRVAVAPDTALVNLGVELRAPSLVDATTEASRRMRAVLERVKALGVGERDITTVAYSVEPVMPPRRPEDETARIAGYRVLNVVQLRVRDLTAVGRIVEAAMGAGATTIRGVRFTTADPAKPQAQARALAVRDADAKARQLADAAGVRLGELVSLSEGVAAPRPMGERFDVGVATATAPGPVEPGQLEIVVILTAHYRIEK
jgi:uncharacterized protein YggE